MYIKFNRFKIHSEITIFVTIIRCEKSISIFEFNRYSLTYIVLALKIYAKILYFNMLYPQNVFEHLSQKEFIKSKAIIFSYSLNWSVWCYTK